jgi:hypothetical protein
MPVKQQPEACLARIADCIDAGGRITSSDTIEFLQAFVDAFEQWIRRLQPKPVQE